ncbi:MAG: M48 family metallopeptidase [Burkholderiales bacterium]|nr:M48 family metallopeptidase [Burkholderiales bacterium]
MSAAGRHPGRAYGPGFQTAGAAVEFEVSGFGLRVVTADAPDGTPRWSEITVRKGGFNDAQVMLEWQGRAGSYALVVSDAAAVAALRAQLAQSAPEKARLRGTGHLGADARTRRWSHLMVWATLLPIVLPIVLLVLLLAEHDRIAAWAVSHVPVAQERKLGEAVFAQAKARLRLVDGPPQAMVREIGARLTRGSPYAYEFHVAEDATVNAFAMPGGFIVVHTGLLALAGSAEEVAGVLAHEVQHVERRHSLKAMVKSAGLMVTVSLLFGDLGGLVSVGQDLIGLKFSRDHESEADAEGLKMLVAAGIRPQGMRDFFRRMSEQEKLDLGWLSSHPASETRFAAMDAALKAMPAAAVDAPALPYDYAAIKAALPAATKPAPPPREHTK